MLSFLFVITRDISTHRLSPRDIAELAIAIRPHCRRCTSQLTHCRVRTYRHLAVVVNRHGVYLLTTCRHPEEAELAVHRLSFS